ncbi:hypothetical protein WMY93_025645 [Mugilogobius chulae]|uniref:C2H2-type domain-containing protein n=1 Tax=Mugilogobius chulae TaxID=88201 RepID=A0AAW0MYR4_9GOBI
MLRIAPQPPCVRAHHATSLEAYLVRLSTIASDVASTPTSTCLFRAFPTFSHAVSSLCERALEAVRRPMSMRLCSEYESQLQSIQLVSFKCTSVCDRVQTTSLSAQHRVFVHIC